ncbi:hypothetical protein GCM10011572_46930 [Pseudoduganella buxea]|uniref:Uncharacterized protein n=1 Tax=Pseudoduganella buxea TaxID=1949069 RepID=A0ABQ1L9Z2_9BURK|nr:hypothetical protein GCM10011572_46930 [Pseudoduganella buxea]
MLPCKLLTIVFFRNEGRTTALMRFSDPDKPRADATVVPGFPAIAVPYAFKTVTPSNSFVRNVDQGLLFNQRQ